MEFIEVVYGGGLFTLVGVLIRELFKSIRINQLKNIDNSKIESIGKYEKRSSLSKLFRKDEKENL